MGIARPRPHHHPSRPQAETPSAPDQKPQNSPSAYYEGFKETFDYLYEDGGRGNPKWVDLLLHCDLGGRPTLMPVFERAIRYAQGREGVWFARRRDLAQWVLDLHTGRAQA